MPFRKSMPNDLEYYLRLGGGDVGVGYEQNNSGRKDGGGYEQNNSGRKIK